MKERPILFSGPMVRAILEGRKTQTRRLVKPHPLNAIFHNGEWIQAQCDADPNNHILKCPYGKPGDRLWVRETFALISDHDHLPPSASDDRGIWWRASLPEFPEGYAACHGKWRPSIHMPRWASRILLEIVSVRVERLNDISDNDSKAEGIEPRGISLRTAKPETWTDYLGRNGAGFVLKRESFKSLWESINGPGSWDKNPWVWVVEFKRVDPWPA